MSVVTDIADAMVDALNGSTFSETFEAVRSFRPRYAMKDLDTLRVTVVPKSRTQEQLTRTSNREEIEIDVGIHKQVGADESAIADMLDLADEIIDFFDRMVLDDAKAIGVTNDPVYDPAKINEDNVFFTVLTFRWFLARTAP